MLENRLFFSPTLLFSFFFTSLFWALHFRNSNLHFKLLYFYENRYLDLSVAKIPSSVRARALAIVYRVLQLGCLKFVEIKAR